MPYIGAKQLKASDLKRFSVTGSTSATHALSWTAPNEQSLIITINGVKQHDGSYTISGSPTTITLSSALVSSDEMEVIGINDIGTTITPAQNSVNTDKIADNAVTTAKIADDQITSAKLANAINITSGNSLTIDSGATITNNGTASGFGVSNDVVFVKRSADQSLSANTTTKVQFDSEIYDSNNWFDSTTNYRFQPNEAGNYLCFANIALSNAYYANQPFNIFFYKNGSEFLGTTTNHRYDETMMDTFSGVINLNGSTDYVEVYARFSQSVSIESSSNNTTSGTSTTAYFVRLT